MYEIRDPIHGFIRVNDWELAVINSQAFQRLRRIKQLALTSMPYPGANHTRFEHSLGVMHVADRLIKSIFRKYSGLLKEKFGFDEAGLMRTKQLIRFAALLHDIGHPPFSHAVEELFPQREGGTRYKHEHYSKSIVEYELAELIEGHPSNVNYNIKVSEIIDFIVQDTSSPLALFRALISGQMDADRMDYLLRDSYFCGVNYGRFDLDRVVATVALCEDDGELQLGINEDGIHAVEGLLLARYMMFTQVYFHKTRSIYDYHLCEAIKEILKPSGGSFPSPTPEGIRKYLAWDDWRVCGLISDGRGKDHGKCIMNREHYRLVHSSPEVPSIDDMEQVDTIMARLTEQNLAPVKRESKKSWYALTNEEILVRLEPSGGGEPLSNRSRVVAGLAPVIQSRVYVPGEHRAKAESICTG